MCDMKKSKMIVAVAVCMMATVSASAKKGPDFVKQYADSLNAFRAQQENNSGADTPLSAYSSYQLFTKDRETIKRNHILKTIDEIVDTSRILSYFGDDKDQYRRFVEGATEHDEHEKLIMKEMGEDELWLPN